MKTDVQFLSSHITSAHEEWARKKQGEREGGGDRLGNEEEREKRSGLGDFFFFLQEFRWEMREIERDKAQEFLCLGFHLI